MSLMDLFRKKGTVSSDPYAERGDFKDWFLNMKGRGPFGGGTARPTPGSKRGNWIDWFLNRRGPAGKFGGSERYDSDYYNPYGHQLFQGGGSVQSGPRNRQKLQPRSGQAHRVALELRGTIPDFARGKKYEPTGEPFNPPVKRYESTGEPLNTPMPMKGILNAASNSIFQKSKNVYDWLNENPWIPNVDIGDKQLGYDFDKPLMGGDLSYGFEYDLDDEDSSAYLNWRKMI